MILELIYSDSKKRGNSVLFHLLQVIQCHILTEASKGVFECVLRETIR